MMEPPINEEGYTGGSEEVSSLQEGYNGECEKVSSHAEPKNVCTHNAQCCSHDSMVNRIQALQMSMQSLDFSIRELKDGQSKMLWKLIAVIGVTSFLCGYLGIHNWLNVLFG